MIEVLNLHKSYRTQLVVDSLSFSISSGEILGLLGPNGAGKTTTVKMLYGLVSPDKGQVRINGLLVSEFPREVRSTIGVVPQEDNLDPDFSAKENLIRFATYYGLSASAAKTRAEELLKIVKLSEHADKSIEALSGGMKRKLVLARALINKPKAIFLDEPTTGLDPDARQDFWKLVQLLKDDGTAILLTTHYMDEAERLCDKVVLMQDGKAVETSTPKNLILKHVGLEIIEISQVDNQLLKAICEKFSTWSRAYGLGSVIGVPPGKSLELLQTIESLSPERTLKRPANLEDVFLSLTGVRLD